MRNLSTTFLVIVVSIFCSCDDYIEERKNSPEDIKQGIEFAQNYYGFIKTQNFKKAVEMLDTTSIHEVDGLAYLQQMDSVFGNIKDYKPDVGISTTKLKNGVVYFQEIEILYKTKYSNANLEERVRMRLFNNTFKIIGYHYEMKVN